MVDLNKLRAMNLHDVADEIEELRLCTRLWPLSPTEEMVSAMRGVDLFIEGDNVRLGLDAGEAEAIYTAFMVANHAPRAVLAARVVHKEEVPCIGSAKGRIVYTVHVVSDLMLEVGEGLYALKGGVL